jgi:diguanylate cyclase (GGDEF)-like protein
MMHNIIKFKNNTLLPLALLFVSGVAMMYNIYQGKASSETLKRTYTLLNVSKSIQTLSTIQNDRFKSHLFTSDKGTLKPVDMTQNLISNKLIQLQKLTADNPVQQRQVISIHTAFDSFINESNLLLPNKGGLNILGPSISVKSDGEVNHLYAIMIKRLQEFDSSLHKLSQHKEKSASFTRLTSEIVMLISLLLGVMIFLRTNNDLNKEITERKAIDAKNHLLAFYDPLTTLPNRRLFLMNLPQVIAASKRSGRKAALLFLDLDHFKTLNDTQGHLIGDMLLTQVANRLNNAIREGDAIARIGGDEFVVLLKDLKEDIIEAVGQAEVISKKLLKILNQPHLLNGCEYISTSSIGVAMLDSQIQSGEDLLKQADIAMYQAKRAGRNMLRFFDPLMQDMINSRVQLESDLHKALNEQQFQLYYQIQVGSTGLPIGAEALIRWNHPERGMISPFHFIPVAEETGIIVPIGAWVLDTACAQLAIWQKDSLTSHIELAVNISAKQFKQDDFVEQVRKTIARHNIDTAKLKLELTESMLIDDINDIITKMNELNAIGIRFSLDDFGTGYSSLQLLKKLPLSQLKIDQSFIRDITTDNNDRAIVRAIIAIARALNLNIIAEGVETDKQLAYLRNYGCDNYQGYLFSKPLPIEELGVVLKKNYT